MNSNFAASEPRKAARENPPNTDSEPNRPAETEGDSAHMGASEAQVIPTAPPTEALDKMLNEPSRPDNDPETANDQLTPG